MGNYLVEFIQFISKYQVLFYEFIIITVFLWNKFINSDNLFDSETNWSLLDLFRTLSLNELSITASRH